MSTELPHVPLKHPKEIPIREQRQNYDVEFSSKEPERQMQLAEKIEEYVIRLGYSNAHVLSIMVQLLTQGKIRVEFRNYIERMELMDMNDRVTRSQAVTIVDKYISEVQGAQKNEQPGFNVTQRIIIQTPKRN